MRNEKQKKNKKNMSIKQRKINEREENYTNNSRISSSTTTIIAHIVLAFSF